MSQDTVLKYLDRFYRPGAETAYVQRSGYRSIHWSYRQVAMLAYQFARELESRGINKGDCLILWGQNCAEWVAVFLGCIYRGVIAAPMDLIASVDFAGRVFDQVEAKLWVCSRGQAGSVGAGPCLILEDLPGTLAGRDATPYPAPDLTGEDPIQIVFTSGTTAEPKGVVITHKNVMANLDPLEREIRKYLKYERIVHPLRFLDLLPLSHVFGQFMSIFVPQCLAGIVVFHDSLNPTEILSTIKKERVSVLVAVPRFLESLRDKIERDFEAEGILGQFQAHLAAAEGTHFLKRWWRFRRIHRQFGWKFWAFISGGAALDYETERFWGRLGYAVIQGYGLTETTSLISVNHPFKLGRGSIGKVLPGREIKLDDNGEIMVRGNNIAAGYYQAKRLKPVLGEEGWFHTGDMGAFDESGNLYFKGRKKDVIVTPEGMKIYPEDLETALRRQPEVRDCVVFGFALAGNAEPCAALILSKRMENPDVIIKNANKSLAEFQHIRRWYVWPEEDFPRTSTQKPRINIIQDYVKSRMMEKSEDSTSANNLADLITRITGRKTDRLSPGANLSTDLNLSSIERVELMSALEDRYQLDINETNFTAATTVGDLEEILRRPVPRRSDYRYPAWAQSLPVAAMRLAVYYLVTWPATMIMARPARKGAHHLRGVKGPLLFISNHITQVDIGFLLAALPLRYRHTLAVAMLGELIESMRHPPAHLGFLRRLKEQISYWLVVALFNVFPLPQESGFRESFAFAGQLADRGYSVLVFPEGRRTSDGRMSPFMAGVGLLARNLNIPVVPMRIDGLFDLKIRNKKLARPGAVTVTIGRPLRIKQGDEPGAIAKELERQLSLLEP